MVFRKPDPAAASPALMPACRMLRNKAMYVTGQLGDVHHPDEDPGHGCWCNMTQHVYGLDGQVATRATCVEGRECYRE